MPATRIQVFRDPAAAATSSGPSTPRRRTAPASGAKGLLTRSGAIEVRGGGGRNSAKGTLATAAKSFITTNVSTVTIDKENRDPVTGLPLSSLLAPGSKGKKGAAAPQKYIATTITTTVLSPVSPMPLEPSSSLSKARKGGKTRVALGVVKKTNASSAATLLPVTSSFPSLADADTDDEEQGGAPNKARAPRRSLRIAPGNSLARLAPATAPKTTNDAGLKFSNKTVKKDRPSKRSASEAASSSTLTNDSVLASTSQAGKLAAENHAAAVAAAVEAQEHAQVFSEQLDDANAGAASMSHVLPARKKRRTSGRKSIQTSSSASVLRTLSGGVRAFEVFSPVADSMTSVMSGDGKGTRLDPNVHMPMENACSEEAAAAAVQRIIDQQCRELTVLPLANVSDAYVTSRSVSVCDDSTMC